MSNKVLFSRMLEKELWSGVINAQVRDKFDVFFSTFTYYFDMFSESKE